MGDTIEAIGETTCLVYYNSDHSDHSVLFAVVSEARRLRAPAAGIGEAIVGVCDGGGERVGRVPTVRPAPGARLRHGNRAARDAHGDRREA